MDGFGYSVRMAQAAVTAAKTLIQIKTGLAPVEILSARVFQITKTTSELLTLQMIQHTGSPTGGTVTSVAPIPLNSLSPAALAVNSTSATGTNATAEPTGGTANVMKEEIWNVLNGVWQYLPIPEERIIIPQGGKLFTLKLNTAPAASMTLGAVVIFSEYQ